jgi:PKD repeat protein
MALILSATLIYSVLDAQQAAPPVNAGAYQFQIATTPLQASGLVPTWQENFTDGSLGHMQYTWAKGFNEALRSYVAPGFVYLGKEGHTDWPHVEQELNNYKAYDTEPLPHTIEFDVLNPYNGSGRLSLRPRRRGDFAHMRLGLPDNKTQVNFRFINGQPGVVVSYNEPTGPGLGWTHVTVSYEQYTAGNVVYGHYVLAINEEVREFQAPSGITNPDWLSAWEMGVGADGWSIEHTSAEDVFGKYIANVRGYGEFLTKAQMQARLNGRVTSYLAGLSDPRNYTGPKKWVQLDQPIELYGPNAITYATQVGALQVRLDGSLSSSWALIENHAWNFGDGNTGSGRTLEHAYPAPGNYTATLTVTNEYGMDTRSLPVHIRTLLLAPEQSGMAAPGAQIVFTHTLTNYGNSVDSFNLTATPNPAGWTAQVSSSSVGPVAANGAVTFTVTIQVPANAPADSVGSVTVTAQSQTFSFVTGSLVDSVTAKTIRGVSLSGAQSGFATPGGQIVFTHHVTNTGNAMDNFDLLASVSKAGWSASASPGSSGALAPGAMTTFSVTVNLPGGINPQITPVTVKAVSQADGITQMTTQDQVTVLIHSVYLPANLSD